MWGPFPILFSRPIEGDRLVIEVLNVLLFKSDLMRLLLNTLLGTMFSGTLFSR